MGVAPKGKKEAAKRRVAGEGAIDQLPSGKWRARYRGPNGSRSSRTFPTKEEASGWLGEQRTDARRGLWIDPSLGRVTFKVWTDSYLENSEKRATTAARDATVLKKHFLPQLGHLALSAITPVDVMRAVKTMKRRLAPATVRTNYAVLKAVLNAAVDAEVIARSPCKGVSLSPDVRQEREPLTSEQLLALAQALPVEYQPLAYLGGVLGLRWSEVVGLQVHNLDFFGNTLSVESTISEVNGRLTPAETKTSASRRRIAVPDSIMTMLSEHLARRGLNASQAEALVFVGPQGGPLRAANFRARVWRPAVDKAGVAGLTFHGLRHSATSLMVQVGLHPRVIQHRLGHSSSRLSMELYAHISADADRTAASQLETGFWVTTGSRRRKRRSSH
jgi:integrase